MGQLLVITTSTFGMHSCGVTRAFHVERMFVEVRSRSGKRQFWLSHHKVGTSFGLCGARPDFFNTLVRLWDSFRSAENVRAC